MVYRAYDEESNFCYNYQEKDNQIEVPSSLIMYENFNENTSDIMKLIDEYVEYLIKVDALTKTKNDATKYAKAEAIDGDLAFKLGQIDSEKMFNKAANHQANIATNAEMELNDILPYVYHLQFEFDKMLKTMTNDAIKDTISKLESKIETLKGSIFKINVIIDHNDKQWAAYFENHQLDSEMELSKQNRENHLEVDKLSNYINNYSKFVDHLKNHLSYQPSYK